MEKEISARVEQILTSKFSAQFISGNREEMLKAVNVLIKKNKGITADLRQQLVHVLNDRWPIPRDAKEKVAKLLEANDPKDIIELLKTFVVNAPYSGLYRDGHYFDLSEEKVRGMARELKKIQNQEWLQYLSLLQEGEQRQTFNFANEIGRIWEQPEKILDVAINVLSTISEVRQNGSFLTGLVSGITDERIIRGTIDKLIRIDNVSIHSLQLNRYLSVNRQDVEKMFPVFVRTPEAIANLQYIKFDALSNQDLESLIPSLISFGDFGPWISIEILFELTNSKPGRLEDLQPLIVRALTQERILITPSYSQLSFHFYEELAKRIINTPSQEKLAEALTNEIILACGEFSFYNEIHIRDILFILLDQYWDTVWPMVGDEILKTTNYSWFNLRNLLTKYRKFDADKLLAWVSANLPDGPMYCMLFSDIELVGEDGQQKLNPIVQKLLDLYGSDDRLLAEFSAKLHSYSTSGSTIPIFKNRIELLSGLLVHAIPAVRLFAQREIDYFNVDIEKEKMWLQNYNLGEISRNWT